MSTRNDSNVIILNDGPNWKAASNFSKCEGSHCGGETSWKSASDRRGRYLYSNQPKEFDRPPYDFSVNGLCFDDVYNNPLLGKNMVYDSYANVDIGRFMYYVDPTLLNPYPKEVYTIPSTVIPVAWQDPALSVVRTEHVKIPTNERISPYQDTEDRLRHREDLMAHKAIKISRVKYKYLLGDEFAQQMGVI